MRTLNSLNAATGAKRSAIIAAALECFVEMGYSQATMEKIRDCTGVSNGSLYHHFKSKDELAAAVYLEGIANYQNGLLAEFLEAESAEQGVAAIVRYHLGWVRRNKSWAVFLFRMRHADPMSAAEENLSEANAKFLKPISERFRKWRADGEVRDMPYAVFLSLILGPCQEMARLWLSGTMHISMDRAAEEISRAAWAAVKT